MDSSRARKLAGPLGLEGVAVLAAAFVLHLTVTLSYPNLAWPDEIFQTLEQGHRLAFGYGTVPWEYRDGLRSWFLPGLLGLVMKLTGWMGSGSAGYLAGANVFLTLLSLAPVAVALLWSRREGHRAPWVAGVLAATWFELVFFSGKALTEAVAGYALAPACFATALLAARSGGTPGAKPGAELDARQLRSLGLWAGALWGLTVGLRIHLAPAALVGLAFACRRDWQRWRWAALGLAGVVLAFGLLDWATWTYPFQSMVLNVWVNIFKGKAASYGQSEALEYVYSLAAIWGWGALPLLALAGYSWRTSPLPLVLAGVIFLTHSAISHKEYRFLAPVLVLVVLAAALGLGQLVTRSVRLGAVAGLVMLAATVSGASRYDWRDLTPRTPGAAQPMWTFRAGELRAYSWLAVQPDVCGVGTVGMGWAWTGGYVYLHRNVQLYEVNGNDGFRRTARGFNAVVAPDRFGPQLGPYARKQCWEGACVFLRPGSCETPPGYDFNGWVKSNGW